jgi:hypothetical protein
VSEGEPVVLQVPLREVVDCSSVLNGHSLKEFCGLNSFKIALLITGEDALCPFPAGKIK